MYESFIGSLRDELLNREILRLAETLCRTRALKFGYLPTPQESVGNE